MYVIQKHKAIKFILNTLKWERSLGTYNNYTLKIDYHYGIPMISCDNVNCNTLEKICWGVSTRTGSFITFFIVNVLKIYGIKNICNSGFRAIELHDIQRTFQCGLSSTGGGWNPLLLINSKFIMTIKNDNNEDGSWLLLFLVDPLQAIKKIENTFENNCIQSFFEYIQSTITKQDDELLLKYLLIGQLVNKFMIPDIGHVIVGTIICLLL